MALHSLQASKTILQALHTTNSWPGLFGKCVSSPMSYTSASNRMENSSCLNVAYKKGLGVVPTLHPRALQIKESLWLEGTSRDRGQQPH